MNQELIQNIAQLRACVAFLGEKEQANWWPSSFLSRSGEAFLAPVFPKTAGAARINGASMAAQRAHDEYIGVGDVFHLFRLPENIEQELSQLLTQDTSVLDVTASDESAREALQTLAADGAANGIGPLLIELPVVDQNMLKTMASAYIQGFISEEPVYPHYRGAA